jgi:hypothetical protein
VQTVKADEVIAALGDDVDRYVLMTDGYSPSVTLGYNHRRYWPVFGPAFESCAARRRADRFPPPSTAATS